MTDWFDWEWLQFFRKRVVIEVPEIIYETETGILIEWNRQNAWLAKGTVKIKKKENSIEVKIPRWLFEKKFS